MVLTMEKNRMPSFGGSILVRLVSHPQPHRSAWMGKSLPASFVNTYSSAPEEPPKGRLLSRTSPT